VGEAGAPPAPPVRAGRKRVLVLGGALAGVLALGVGGFFAFSYFTTPEPPPLPKKAAPAAKAPAPVPPAAAPASGPIAQTKATLAPVNGARADATNEVVAASAAPSGPAPTAAAPTTAAALTPAAPSGPPPANPAFREWVKTLKISGVRGGSTPRVFIERTAYGPGDLVNPALGITFEGYDAERRVLLFKDKTGATVERRN
jgi:hypothetical protein